MKKSASMLVLLLFLSFVVLVDAEPSWLMWSQTYGGTADEGLVHDVYFVETSDGGYALFGSTYSFGAGEADFWLVKTDGSGNMEWNQTYGGPYNERAYCLVETSDGGYAVAGKTTAFDRDGDFWLIKTDEQGIIPEFPSWIVLPLAMIVILIVAVLRRRGARRRIK